MAANIYLRLGLFHFFVSFYFLLLLPPRGQASSEVSLRPRAEDDGVGIVDVQMR